MKDGNRKSKRVKLAKLHKQEKLVKRSQANKRRQSRKNPDSRPRLRKDLGIPNLCPFKAEILREVEEIREKAEAEEIRAHAARVAAQTAEKNKVKSVSTTEATANEDVEITDAPSTSRSEEIAAAIAMRDAKQDGNEDEEKPEEEEEAVGEKKDLSKRQFLKKHVVESADVVLEVVDSRDPQACRCREAEKLVKESGGKKKLIIVMNKVDLIPHEVLVKWMRFLRDEWPTIAFKASTQRGAPTQSNDINVRSAPEDLVHSSSECLGADALLQLLKNYCRGADGSKSARSITVGVVGFPNTGKSSLINSLKRMRAVGVSSTPGFTREISEVRLDKHILLLDSPGVVFDSNASENASNGDAPVLLNCLRPENVIAESAVEALLSRAPHETLLNSYKIGTWTTTKEFLTRVAQRRGKLRKGGIPDVEAAARVVVADVACGKIPFWAEPPVREGVHLEAEIVDGFAPRLDLTLDEPKKKQTKPKQPKEKEEGKSKEEVEEDEENDAM